VGATKVAEISDEKKISSIDYEFNLLLPNKQRYNRHEEVKELLGLFNKNNLEV